MSISRWGLVSLLAVALGASAQSGPARPRLDSLADTNDAGAYVSWARARLLEAPDKAAAAYEWAARIDPGRWEAWYGRWVALRLADSSDALAHFHRNREALAAPTCLRIDSVALQAIMIAPLQYRDLDLFLFRRLVPERNSYDSAYQRQRLHAQLNSEEVTSLGQTLDWWNGGHNAAPPVGYVIDPTLAPGFRAWGAYAIGNLPRALEDYAKALKGSTEPFALYAERARTFALSGGADSALAQLRLAVRAFPRDTTQTRPFVYESVAIDEQMTALLFEFLKKPDSARAAYARALAADPTYAPAHLGLSALDLRKGDTAAAFGELDLASQSRPDDAAIAYLYGLTLARAAHDAEAAEQFKRAIQLAPYYAAPRIVLAALYDDANMKKEAAEAYAGFLAVAAKKDPMVPRAQERLAALQ